MIFDHIEIKQLAETLLRGTDPDGDGGTADALRLATLVLAASERRLPIFPDRLSDEALATVYEHHAYQAAERGSIEEAWNASLRDIALAERNARREQKALDAVTMIAVPR